MTSFNNNYQLIIFCVQKKQQKHLRGNSLIKIARKQNKKLFKLKKREKFPS